MKRQKLWTAIKSYNGRIKLGSAPGSGYFYLGDGMDLRVNIDRYDKILCDYEGDRVRRARQNFEFLRANQPDFVSFAEKYPDGDAETYMRYVDEWLNEYRRRKNKYKQLEEDYVNRKHLKDRIVVKNYSDNTFDSDAKSILIDTGNIYGAYWTFDELQEPMAFGSGEIV